MRTMRLGEVATYTNGRAFKPSEWSDVGVRIIRIENLNDPTAPYNRYAGSVEPKHLVADGDLLVSWSASLDAYVWERGPAVLNQHIFKVQETDAVERRFLYFALRAVMSEIRSRVHGATMRHVTKGEFESVAVPVPSRAAQHLVATSLTTQLSVAERSRVASEKRCDAARQLELSCVASVLLKAKDRWRSVNLGSVTTSRPSPSTTSDGEVPILSVTSGCLTPTGFDSKGLTPNRMSAAAAGVGRLAAGEVLVARSNTPGLVGRAALYEGDPPGITATDLAFRVVPDRVVLDPDYLARYLSALQLSGYWRARASGASSTMSKITRAQLQSVQIPLPPLMEQRAITAETRRNLSSISSLMGAVDAEFEAVQALPEVLLRHAFNGPNV